MKRPDPGKCLARLTALLTEETAHLRRGDVGSAMALVEEKQRTAADVRDYAVDGSLAAIPEAAATLRHLRREIELNKQALEHALRVQRALVGIIADAARRTAPVRSYGRTGLALTQGSGRVIRSCRA